MESMLILIALKGVLSTFLFLTVTVLGVCVAVSIVMTLYVLQPTLKVNVRLLLIVTHSDP